MFEKWEEKVLTNEEYSTLLGQKKAKFMLSVDATHIKAKVKVEKPKPTGKPSVPEPKEEEVDFDEVPQKLEYEIIRDEGAKIFKGSVDKRQEILFRKFKPFPRAYFINHVIKRVEYDKKGNPKKPRFVVRLNEYWSEALDVNNKIIPEFSQELANLLVADWMIQAKNALGKQGLVLNADMMKILLLGFAFAIPFGFFMDSLWGLIPTHVVNWVP